MVALNKLLVFWYYWFNTLDPGIDYCVLHLIVSVDSEALLEEIGQHEMTHVTHDSQDHHKLIMQNSCVKLEVTILMLSWMLKFSAYYVTVY